MTPTDPIVAALREEAMYIDANHRQEGYRQADSYRRLAVNIAARLSPPPAPDPAAQGFPARGPCTCNRNYVDDDEHSPECGTQRPADPTPGVEKVRRCGACEGSGWYTERGGRSPCAACAGTGLFPPTSSPPPGVENAGKETAFDAEKWADRVQEEVLVKFDSKQWAATMVNGSDEAIKIESIGGFVGFTFLHRGGNWRDGVDAWRGFIAEALEAARKDITAERDGARRELAEARKVIERLPKEWREAATASREEAGRIRRTIKNPTGAEERCNVRAEVWDRCAKDLEAARTAAAGEEGK